MLATFEQVENDLGQLIQPLSGCMHRGFDRFLDLPVKDRLDMRTTTHAGIVRDFQVTEIEKIIEEYDDLRSHRVGELFILLIKGKYAIRVKKLRHDRKSSNQPTQQVEDFRNQTFSLPGVPTITCLELGYTLNEFGRISDIFIVCPNGKYSNHWEWGIDSGDLDESNLPIELPPDLPPSGLAEEEKPRRRYSGKEEESHEEQGASSESEGEQ